MKAASHRWYAGIACRLAVGMLAAAVLSGCLGSKNPITPPESARIDERLLGAWVTTDLYYNETFYMHVMQRADSGAMDIYEIRYNESRTGSESSGRAHVSVLGDRHFLNLQGPPDAGMPDDGPHYSFVAYEFDDRGNLIVSLLSENTIAAAFAAGRLAGKVQTNVDFVATLISDSSEHIADYLASADAASLVERRVTFRRVVPQQ